MPLPSMPYELEPLPDPDPEPAPYPEAVLPDEPVMEPIWEAPDEYEVDAIEEDSPEVIRVPYSDAPPELASLLLDTPACIYLSASGCL